MDDVAAAQSLQSGKDGSAEQASDQTASAADGPALKVV
jgi:hypothetical protein